MSNTVERLPMGKQIAYAIGQLGWSILINLVAFYLVKFYIPPEVDNMPTLISRATFFVVINAIVIIAAMGRIWDAITDPIIASLSDRSKNPRGRRIPFLLYGAVPAAFFCVLQFTPPDSEPTWLNIAWLIGAQLLFYLFLTIYVTPFFALVAELGHTPTERLTLSTLISVTYALGIIVASQAPAIWEPLIRSGYSPVEARQIAFAVLSAFAAACMLVPVFFIDEKRYCLSEPSDVPLFTALMKTFHNRNFLHYTAADFAYFMGLTIIQTGIAYYITIMLGLAESWLGILMPVMLLTSFVFYGVVFMLARRIGKRILVLAAFAWFAGVFAIVYFLGNPLPVDPVVQGFVLMVVAAVPMAFLGVLPNAILADIAEHDALKTGIRQEGMFFAARTFMQKLGQTLGIVVFAGLTTFGIDPGNDLGIRLSGVAGVVLCLAALVFFFGYGERELLKETFEMQYGDKKDGREA